MNSVDGWYFYNHAILPEARPTETVDTSILNDKSVWKKENWGGRTPLLARWTSDFDCKEDTGFWYTICDSQFDIKALKAKRRNVITNGLKYFDVKTVDPRNHVDELFHVHCKAFESYGKKPRPYETFKSEVEAGAEVDRWYVGIFKETGRIEAYARVYFCSECVCLNVLKANPEYEHYQSNAAIVYSIVTDSAGNIASGGYINDGMRNVSHVTNFQSYLIKYFGFRKAFCRLNIRYNPKIGWIVRLVYPFRKLLMKFGSNKIIHMVNGVLLMEELARNSQKK